MFVIRVFSVIILCECMVRRYIMTPRLKIHKCIAWRWTCVPPTMPCSLVTEWICKRAFSSLRNTELSSRSEDCCRRGLAKFTIKLSRPESRTPSYSLSLINWDLGSTWVSLVARFKWLLVNDRATPWNAQSSRPEKMRLWQNVINSLSRVMMRSFSAYRSMHLGSCSL